MTFNVQIGIETLTSTAPRVWPNDENSNAATLSLSLSFPPLSQSLSLALIMKITIDKSWNEAVVQDIDE